LLERNYYVHKNIQEYLPVKDQIKFKKECAQFLKHPFSFLLASF